MDIYQNKNIIPFISTHNQFHLLGRYCKDPLMGFLIIILHIVFKYLIYLHVEYLRIKLMVHVKEVLMMYHCFTLIT